jgi:hypothetical protein
VRRLPADVLPEAEPLLLDVARAGSPADVRAGVERIAELLDPERFDHDDGKARARRRFDLSPTTGGWWAVDGHLPPECGQRLAAALADYAAAAGPLDLRTATQRRADAVADIADAALAGHPTGITAVTIVADADQLDGPGARWDPTGMPVGASTFDLAVCQGRLQLVVAARSGIGWKPLAVGLTARYATTAQRAALNVRDHGCAFRGCTRPARRCHAHHIVDWRAGGPTDLSNLVLLCAYHHRMVHLGRAHLIPDPDSPARHIAVPTRRHIPAAAA